MFPVARNALRTILQTYTFKTTEFPKLIQPSLVNAFPIVQNAVERQLGDWNPDSSHSSVFRISRVSRFTSNHFAPCSLMPVRGFAKKRVRLDIEAEQSGSKTDRLRCNNEITSKMVRFVHPEGKHEVLPILDAMTIAQEHSMDLVEVSSTTDPPVCRMMDYNKERFLKKQKQSSKKLDQRKQHTIKEVRVSNRISMHDLETKVGTIRRFLMKGHKVKLSVTGKLSETGEEAFLIMTHTAELVSEMSLVETEPKKEKGGQKVSMMLRSTYKSPTGMETKRGSELVESSSDDDDENEISDVEEEDELRKT
mmetsp:Transcript_19163/g.36688  ORF Transcript_19163/g.36688 Transcript_19163/m.36688 type:complete len:308 (-) Transcript_19163:146-1069(-)